MRLGGGPNIFEPPPTKPHGMWWRTYWKLLEQSEEAESKVWARLGGGRAK